ncbi:RNA polymerase sigma factor (sigma-70 family) [Catenulispora sp. MAP12-49]
MFRNPGETERMTTEVDTALVAAARDGDGAALDALVTGCLPVVSMVIGRALAYQFDAEDAVQETMLHLLRGLPKLREPAAFHSWLMAIATNQIRKHHRPPVPQPPEAFEGLADPGSDVADLVIWELGLARQRRQIAEATRWLDDGDQELLSLWWLTEAGQLSRTRVVTALGLTTHAMSMRVSRMKAKLDNARHVVRALSAAPPCHTLAGVTANWPGRPSPLWRKRIWRHVRDCDHCLRWVEELVPTERLLAIASTALPPSRPEPPPGSYPRTRRTRRDVSTGCGTLSISTQAM